LLIADTNYNQSGISIRRKCHGISRDKQVIVIDQRDVFVDFYIGNKVVLIVFAGEKTYGQNQNEAGENEPENQILWRNIPVFHVTKIAKSILKVVKSKINVSTCLNRLEI
jgi:hypothetical protein